RAATNVPHRGRPHGPGLRDESNAPACPLMEQLPGGGRPRAGLSSIASAVKSGGGGRRRGPASLSRKHESTKTRKEHFADSPARPGRPVLFRVFVLSCFRG